MIDHVSIGVRDIAASARLYQAILATIGLVKLVERDGTIGFGKSYPEFWLNARPDLAAAHDDTGTHICLRTRGRESVDAFHAAALAAGASDDGAPGYRLAYNDRYYAAFVGDPDGNRIEVVTFVEPAT